MSDQRFLFPATLPRYESLEITNCSVVASFNWVADVLPTIMVPGTYISSGHPGCLVSIYTPLLTIPA